MAHTVEMSITAEDFRENYTPAPDPAVTADRHWMLDFGPGRDLLKAALRREKPELKVPYLQRGESLDGELNAMIDKVGFRNVEAPSEEGMFAMTHRCVMQMIRTMLGRV